MNSFVPVLSYGMGIESTAILLSCLIEASVRDFRIDDLIVVTAQTGNEWLAEVIVEKNSPALILPAKDIRST